MRTYGKRFIRGASDKAARRAQESRDAILWDVLTTERMARCKIQGSNEFVMARFPQNWNTIPEWAKAGQAVRIIHRGGNRGFVEIAGFGRAIPTPISGSATPTPTTPDNAILSGCELLPIPQTPRMAIYVRTGTVRFSGHEYAVPAALAKADSPIKADMGLTLGQVAQVFTIPEVSTGKFRYDLFSIGPDLLAYRTAGTEFTTAEIRPTLPSGHLAIKYLLIRSGQTAITAADIAQAWTTPEPASLATTATDNGGTWDIEVEVLDQYGNAITTPTGWNISAAIDGGDGSIAPTSGNTGTTNAYRFVYTEGTAGNIINIGLTLSQGNYTAIGLAIIQL